MDLVAGRSGKTYRDWLTARGQSFRDGVKQESLDPFHGYKNAIDDELADAAAVLDAFHVVKLGTAAVDEVRCRVQQTIHGHRGRRDDPLYRIRNILRAGAERLTERQQARLEAAFDANPDHIEVEVAWRCAQQLRSVYHQASHVAGRRSHSRSSTASPAARSPRSPASDGPCDSGAESSSATSTPAAPTTAAPKP